MRTLLKDLLYAKGISFLVLIFKIKLSYSYFSDGLKAN